MIQKIKSKNFCIQDPKIQEFMRLNEINHLKFVVDIENEIFISAKFPDYDNLLSFDKKWLKVHWGNRVVSVRTPAILKDHIGKNIDVYQEKIFNDKRELFRVKPVDFKLNNIFKKKCKRIKLNIPYFSKSGYCVIPIDYIRKKNINNIQICRLSFNRIDSNLINLGFIFARITKHKDIGFLSYPLKECSNGMMTRTLTKVLDIIYENGKKITDFQYLKTVYDKNYKYDLIVFKEVKIDGS